MLSTQTINNDKENVLHNVRLITDKYNELLKNRQKYNSDKFVEVFFEKLSNDITKLIDHYKDDENRQKIAKEFCLGIMFYYEAIVY